MVFVKTSNGTQKCHKCPFLTQGRPNWIGVWRQLLPTTFGCIYKMLVTFASDREGSNLFYIMKAMFFIVTSNTLKSW